MVVYQVVGIAGLHGVEDIVHARGGGGAGDEVPEVDLNLSAGQAGADAGRGIGGEGVAILGADGTGRTVELSLSLLDDLEHRCSRRRRRGAYRSI